MRNILLDTGPFVALLDSSEKSHERCTAFFKEFRGHLFTTEPVLTEVLYLLGPFIKAQKAGIEFILKGGAMLVPQSQESLSRGLELIEKYKDTPRILQMPLLSSSQKRWELRRFLHWMLKDLIHIVSTAEKPSDCGRNHGIRTLINLP